MIPIPYVIYYAVAFPLQITATKITVVILNAVGMGVVRQGNIIHLADGYSLEVAEACSGMRSLVALLAIGALWAYLFHKRLIARIVLFLSAIPLAVVANVIRVLITTVLVAAISLEVTAEPMHTIMGLSVFVIEFIGLFLVGSVLNKVFR
jgi:exosortase